MTTHAYAKAGTFKVTASPINEFGAATANAVGTVTVKADATKPAVTLTKAVPAHPGGLVGDPARQGHRHRQRSAHRRRHGAGEAGNRSAATILNQKLTS